MDTHTHIKILEMRNLVSSFSTIVVWHQRWNQSWGNFWARVDLIALIAALSPSS
ncbi:hypothetical protein Mapa_013798 [Marchantia paleacea]|nr:hypothetical protein Mapa_013798 [Marchantia paleacea]